VPQLVEIAGVLDLRSKVSLILHKQTSNSNIQVSTPSQHKVESSERFRIDGIQWDHQQVNRQL